MACQASVLGAVSLGLSAVCLALFAYTGVTLAKYTPLYEPLACEELHSALGDPQMDADWVNVSGIMTKRCRNPNHYGVEVSQLGRGEVFVLQGNDTLLPVGSCVVPDVTFPTGGAAVGESRMSIVVPMAEAGTLLAAPTLRVVSKIRVRSAAELRFFGVGIRSGEDKDEVCGFEVTLATKKVGPSACAASLEELAIPDVGAAPQVRLVHMQPEHLAANARRKNVAFGLVLAVTGLTSCALAVLGFWRCCHGRAGSREAQFDEQKDDKV